MHRAEDVLAFAFEPDIERIAGNAERGVRRHRLGFEAPLVFVMAPIVGRNT